MLRLITVALVAISLLLLVGCKNDKQNIQMNGTNGMDGANGSIGAVGAAGMNGMDGANGISHSEPRVLLEKPTTIDSVVVKGTTIKVDYVLIGTLHPVEDGEPGQAVTSDERILYRIHFIKKGSETKTVRLYTTDPSVSGPEKGCIKLRKNGVAVKTMSETGGESFLEVYSLEGNLLRSIPI
jgi:hypothetical protein